MGERLKKGRGKVKQKGENIKEMVEKGQKKGEKVKKEAPADLLSPHVEEEVGGGEAEDDAVDVQDAGLGHQEHALDTRTRGWTHGHPKPSQDTPNLLKCSKPTLECPKSALECPKLALNHLKIAPIPPSFP